MSAICDNMYRMAYSSE